MNATPERKCPYCKGPVDTLWCGAKSNAYHSFCLMQDDVDGCNAVGPYRDTPEAALDAFCGPGERLTLLENFAEEVGDAIVIVNGETAGA